MNKKSIVIRFAGAFLSLALVSAGAHAQSVGQLASSALVSLPLASVMAVGGMSEGHFAESAGDLSLPAVLSGYLVVVAVQQTAGGVVWVLERASDGARMSVQVAGRGVAGASVATGATIAASAIDAGTILTSAGKVLAFIPNAVGRALLHNEQLTN